MFSKSWPSMTNHQKYSAKCLQAQGRQSRKPCEVCGKWIYHDPHSLRQHKARGCIKKQKATAEDFEVVSDRDPPGTSPAVKRMPRSPLPRRNRKAVQLEEDDDHEPDPLWVIDGCFLGCGLFSKSWALSVLDYVMAPHNIFKGTKLGPYFRATTHRRTLNISPFPVNRSPHLPQGHIPAI